MNCTSCKSELTAFLDNETDPRQSGLISLHLDVCPSCREELERMRMERAWWSDLPAEPDPDPGLWNHIQSGLSSGRVSRIRSMAAAWRDFFFPDYAFSWNRAAAACAMAGVLLLSSFGTLSLSPSGTDTAVSAMENYVHWRVRQSKSLTPSRSSSASVEELKAQNPFLEPDSASSRSNPFLPG